MQARLFFEKWGVSRPGTQGHIVVKWRLQQHRCQNRKSQETSKFSFHLYSWLPWQIPVDLKSN